MPKAKREESRGLVFDARLLYIIPCDDYCCKAS